MSALWASMSAEDWNRVHGTCDSVVNGLAEPLCSLEKWYQRELPGLLQEQGYITQAQLSKLMQWKLSKGKWRPRLQAFVDELKDSSVKEASKNGFDALKEGKIREAVAAISELKGVGPATASAVLAAYDSSIPFMGDEALNALSKDIGARQYTLPHCIRFIDAMTARAEALGSNWNAQAVQVTLWIEAQTSSSTTKRKSTAKETQSSKRKKK
ncbi:hypothetical protein THRCLA_21522 [Thraustotheca clavata]|uniref:HhH-GPD domain-containing protein n=1 Tax=Thraustotheca clavata TaxID=74557 RepID=A0A1V9ZVJ0_9STRA|nr:hypothetical protein THRCLA_21522 [Thraustotheca clavata]